MKTKFSRALRIRRHLRVRRRVIGTPLRPRLSVFRSLQHIYAQVVDDSTGHTLVSVSTLTPEVIEKKPVPGKIGQAKLVGSLLAQKSLQKGIQRVVFDRGGYKYHGRVRALAEAAREGGLEF